MDVSVAGIELGVAAPPSPAIGTDNSPQKRSVATIPANPTNATAAHSQITVLIVNRFLNSLRRSRNLLILLSFI
jgi:hypothetical protein